MGHASNAAQNFIQGCAKDAVSVATRMAKMFDRSRLLSDHNGVIEKSKLDEEIRLMDPDDIISLYIPKQNAALLIRRTDTDIIFETWGVTMPSEEVLKPLGNLQCLLPQRSASVSYHNLVTTADRLDQITELVRLLSIYTTSSIMPTTMRGGGEIAEERHKPFPDMLTELLMLILIGYGKQISPTKIRKRIRDDSIYTASRLPFRRSGHWAAMRASAHLLALRAKSEENGNYVYKNFVLNVCDVAVWIPRNAGARPI